jgi:hypothetical protein
MLVGKFSQSYYIHPRPLALYLVFGAGALLSNAEDMLKWHQALYNYTLVKKETLDKAFTPHKLSTATR